MSPSGDVFRRSNCRELDRGDILVRRNVGAVEFTGRTDSSVTEALGRAGGTGLGECCISKEEQLHAVQPITADLDRTPGASLWPGLRPPRSTVTL